MSTDLERQVQRWKLLAVAGFAFAAGTTLGPRLSGGTAAQTKPTRVQLDTSNCTVEAEARGPLNALRPTRRLGRLAGGAMSAEATEAIEAVWLTTVCD